MRIVTRFFLATGILLGGCGGDSGPVALQPEGDADESAAVGVAPNLGRLQADGSPAARGTAPVADVDHPTIPSDPPSIGLPTIHGRVVDLRTGRGRGDQIVSLLQGEARQRTRTDTLGRFRFEPQSALLPRVWLEMPVSWRWISSREEGTGGRVLTAEQQQGKEEVLLEVAERLSGPVSGIAVDSVTGKPLPGHAFSITSWLPPVGGLPATSASVVTDAEGRFSTDVNMSGGRVILKTLYDGPPPTQRIVDCLVGRSASDPWLVEFSVGPTIELALGGAVPDDTSQLEGWIVDSGGRGGLGPWNVKQREDGSYWMRASGHDRPFSDESAVLLTTPDGLTFGASRVGPVLGLTEPIHVELERTGTLTVGVPVQRPEAPELEPRAGSDQSEMDEITDFMIEHGEEASTYQEDLERSLQFEAATMVVKPVHDEPAYWAWRHRHLPSAYRSDWLAGSTMRWLPPGDYMVRVSSRAHASRSSLVTVSAGHDSRLVLPLTYEPGLRRVLGRVVAAGDEPFSDVGVEIRLAGRPVGVWSVMYTNRSIVDGGEAFMHVDPSGTIGTFEFSRVPPGQLLVEYVYPRRPYTITITGEPTGEQTILIEEQILERGFGFRVRSPVADSNSGFFDYDVDSRPQDGGEELFARPNNGQLIAPGDPRDRQFEWAIRKRGYQTVFGDQDDFIEESEGRWFATVELRPGYGGRIEVVDAAGRPVPDAELVADGEVIARSDEKGWIAYSVTNPPRVIKIRSAMLAREKATAILNASWVRFEL